LGVRVLLPLKWDTQHRSEEPSATSIKPLNSKGSPFVASGALLPHDLTSLA
jgi:hypothetical protein